MTLTKEVRTGTSLPPVAEGASSWAWRIKAISQEGTTHETPLRKQGVVKLPASIPSGYDVLEVLKWHLMYTSEPYELSLMAWDRTNSPSGISRDPSILLPVLHLEHERAGFVPFPAFEQAPRSISEPLVSHLAAIKDD